MQASVRTQEQPADSAPELRWDGAATPEAVGAVRHLLVACAARLGASEEVRARLALAVSEAMSNVVVHAYREAEEPGAVHVAAADGDKWLRILIRDHGLGLVPRTDSPGLGFGLGLMAQTADVFSIRTAPVGAGVEVRLEFALGAPAVAA
jgi:anti-sigma regulatory factor (Ser/Thr protein kinase)